MERISPNRLGVRVYLANCIAGEPGVIVGYDRSGKAQVHWPDLYEEMGKDTFHALDTLVRDESFVVSQLDLFDMDEVAA